MSVRRSNEDLANAGLAPDCGICSRSVASAGYAYTTTCGHVFHKSCLSNHTKTNLNCPTCNTALSSLSMSTTALAGIPPSPMTTRSQTQRAMEFDSSRPGVQTSSTPADSFSPPEVNRASGITFIGANANGNGASTSQGVSSNQTEQIKKLVTDAVRAQQAELMSSLSQQLSKLIETNIAASFSRLGAPVQNNTQGPRLSFPPPSTPIEVQTIERLLGLPPNNNNNNTNNNLHNRSQNTSHRLNTSDIHSSPHSHSSFRPDKVGHIILNWRIKFSGDPNGMSIDNFLYRVEALTNQTLNGDFGLLCGHISTLFDGKATDWYWRYHRSVPHIRWSDLCIALRKQYEDTRTDVDFREMIRDRKQKSGESFDTFYEAIVNISDKLSEPLSENVLVEILRRNLLPEIQHEILNLQISSVSNLREICRRREFFLQDLSKKQPHTKPYVHRNKINEIFDDPVESSGDEDQLSAISLICWNCQKAGHRYQECLEDRRVFCYGCGAASVYKPNCSTCNSKNLKACALKSARRQLRTTSTNTD